MASALTVLVLGCWLAGQSRVSGPLAGSLLAGRLPTKEPSYPKPNISLSPSAGLTLGGAVTIRCECRCRGARVLLSKAGDPDARRSMDPMGDVAEFPIRSVSLGDAGNYSCQYSTTLDSPVWSEPSDPMELVVTGPFLQNLEGEGLGQQVTNQPLTSWCCFPGGSEPSPAPGLTRNIIAGVSAAAAGLLLLLLLVAFLCYRRTQGRKGPAPRQSRESEAAATVYALVRERKQLDVLPQEPDPGADGLTYAELDGRALQGKRGGPAPAPEPAQPSEYAAINVNWEPPGV